MNRLACSANASSEMTPKMTPRMSYVEVMAIVRRGLAGRLGSRVPVGPSRCKPDWEEQIARAR